MKNELSEQDLLQKLNIPDWRHMTKDKIVSFASSMPYLNPEVAKAAISQFPQFSKMGNEMINALKESLESAYEKGGESTTKAYEINKQILDHLGKRLNSPFVFPKERDKIIDSMLQVSSNILELDKRAKHFLFNGVKMVAGVVVTVGMMAATILGGNFKKS